MKLNPLTNEVEAYESISNAIVKLKELAREYHGINKTQCDKYVEDIKKLYDVRLNYVIAKSIDMS